jgi:hypothetical protein
MITGDAEFMADLGLDFDLPAQDVQRLLPPESARTSRHAAIATGAFAFLSIDADDGQALALKTGPQRANVLKYPVRDGMDGDLLAIDAQREIHLV